MGAGKAAEQRVRYQVCPAARTSISLTATRAADQLLAQRLAERRRRRTDPAARPGNQGDRVR
jgi:hypothetical protein